MDIELKDICFSYENKPVLKDLTLTLKEGEITVIMAASGAGKSTLLRILAGLETPQSGTITGLSGKKISMLFQENRLLEDLSILENLRFVCGRSLRQMNPIEELLQTGLEESPETPVSQLSGGMKRRVALVRALITPSELLILDEPFQGLDDENKKRCISYMLHRRKNKTMIVVTHEKEEAAAVGGTIFNLRSIAD